MLTFDNQNIEFKQEYVPDIRKEVMGFANADGGTVYVGIRKDGVVLGVSDPDGVLLQIVNSLKDSLAPDIMPFIRVTTIELEEKPVIEIDVTTGTNRPYYLREKGLKPSGFMESSSHHRIFFSVPPFDQYRLLMTRYKNGVIMRRVPFPICANCPPSKKMCPMGSFVPIKNAIARSAPIEEATTSSRYSTPCDFRYSST